MINSVIRCSNRVLASAGDRFAVGMVEVVGVVVVVVPIGGVVVALLVVQISRAGHKNTLSARLSYAVGIPFLQQQRDFTRSLS